MRTPDLAKTFASFSSVLMQKRSILAKECRAVEQLNRALSRTGYQIRPLNPVPHGKRRGRPRGSKNTKPRPALHEASRNGIVKRRPGRPRLRKVA